MISHSQNKQDIFVYEEFFKNKTEPGFFFEAGAVNGLDISNTLFFEKYLNWSGILIECNPIYYERCVKNRKAIVENVAISSVEQPLLFLNAQYLGGLLRFMPMNQIKEIESWYATKKPEIPTIWVEGVKLQTVFNKHNIDRIDYFSLDIEGAELEALKSIDFNKTYIDVMTIECKSQQAELNNLLEQNSFKLVHKLGADLIYKHE
jgi:FkbM family methyltransferase